ATMSVLLLGQGMMRLHAMLGGEPNWSGVYATADFALVVAIAIAVLAAVRRVASPRAAHLCALTLWALLSVVVAVAAPGASGLFTWPLIAASVISLAPMPSTRVAATWLATFVTLAMLAPIAYILPAVMLGMTTVGGATSAVILALVAW